MTAADIILIFIGVIGLLIAFGSFIVALLAFLDRDKDHLRRNKSLCPFNFLISSPFGRVSMARTILIRSFFGSLSMNFLAFFLRII